MVANSKASDSEIINTGLQNWQIMLIAADIVILAMIVLMEFAIVRKYRKTEWTKKAVQEKDGRQ